MFRWDRFEFNKKRAGTRYAELMFMYLVGSAGHVVHSSASGAQNIDALFFILSTQMERVEQNQRHTLFQTKCVIK
jgi:hypothetical protein